MTIEKGGPWGEAPGPAPATASATTDVEVAALAAAAVARHEHLVIELTGPGDRLTGDIAATLGVDRCRPDDQRLRYRFDLAYLRLDDGEAMPFVAHAVARNRAWSGEVAAIMNAAWVGPWYLGPRAHPNDGLLDITVGALPLGQRLLARSRVRSGTHLPHPALTVRRVERWTHRFSAPRTVRLDGRAIGRGRDVEVWVRPDSFSILA